MKELVTSYFNPDLDGTACSVAYAEYLRSEGVDAVVALYGTPHREARFVMDNLAMEYPPDGEQIYDRGMPIHLTDTSYLGGLTGRIDPEDVVEVIDHRFFDEPNPFINAVWQKEHVGAAATLIAEKFQEKDLFPSKESATLLYGAIASNTVNFSIDVATERDLAMSEWLSIGLNLPKTFVADMFHAKSELNAPLKQLIEEDLAYPNFGNFKIGAGQLEIVGTRKLLEERGAELEEALIILAKDLPCDYIYATLLDAEEGITIFIAPHEASKSLLSEAVEGVVFEGNVAFRPGILMRKKILPVLRDIVIQPETE